jgi:hypothetical protein
MNIFFPFVTLLYFFSISAFADVNKSKLELLDAVSKGDIEKVRTLGLEIDVNYFAQFKGSNTSPLHLAVQRCEVDIVKLLIELEASVDIKNDSDLWAWADNRNVPLYFALRQKDSCIGDKKNELLKLVFKPSLIKEKYYFNGEKETFSFSDMLARSQYEGSLNLGQHVEFLRYVYTLAPSFLFRDLDGLQIAANEASFELFEFFKGIGHVPYLRHLTSLLAGKDFNENRLKMFQILYREEIFNPTAVYQCRGKFDRYKGNPLECFIFNNQNQDLDFFFSLFPNSKFNLSSPYVFSCKERCGKNFKLALSHPQVSLDNPRDYYHGFFRILKALREENNRSADHVAFEIFLNHFKSLFDLNQTPGSMPYSYRDNNPLVEMLRLDAFGFAEALVRAGANPGLALESTRLYLNQGSSTSNTSRSTWLLSNGARYKADFLDKFIVSNPFSNHVYEYFLFLLDQGLRFQTKEAVSAFIRQDFIPFGYNQFSRALQNSSAIKNIRLSEIVTQRSLFKYKGDIEGRNELGEFLQKFGAVVKGDPISNYCENVDIMNWAAGRGGVTDALGVKCFETLSADDYLKLFNLKLASFNETFNCQNSLSSFLNSKKSFSTEDIGKYLNLFIRRRADNVSNMICGRAIADTFLENLSSSSRYDERIPFVFDRNWDAHKFEFKNIATKLGYLKYPEKYVVDAIKRGSTINPYKYGDDKKELRIEELLLNGWANLAQILSELNFDASKLWKGQSNCNSILAKLACKNDERSQQVLLNLAKGKLLDHYLHTDERGIVWSLLDEFRTFPVYLTTVLPVSSLETRQLIDYSFDSMTLLMTVAAKGDIEGVKYLIKAGSDLKQKSRLGMTARDYAVKNGNSKVVVLLDSVK